MPHNFSQEERESLLKTMSDLIILSGREGIDNDLKMRLIDNVLAMSDQLKSRLIMSRHR